MTNDPKPSDLNRRQFIIRSTKAGAALAATWAVGYGLYDTVGPSSQAVRQTSVSLADFSVSSQQPRMCVARGADRKKSLAYALKAVGGLESYIKSGDRVLLKVNAAFATPPMLSATTHPILVTELCRRCFQAGAANVIVTDNPINDPTSCFTLTGIAEAARSAGAELIVPRQQSFRPITVPNARLIRDWPLLYEPFRQVNKVIGITPVKDHHRSGASMVMKNWYGLLGGRRNIFHQEVHTIIKELAMMVRPTLVILDGTTTMMRNGPTGGSLSDLKSTNTMIVSTDQVAADAFGATLLGKNLSDLPFIAQAQEAGIGTADYQSLNPQMVDIS